MKIYDLFMYSGEQEILDIRLNSLYPHVDFFCIGSSQFSHSGINKGLNTIPNYLLEKFKDKIIFYEIPYTPNPDPWVFETFSREYIYEQIKDKLNPEDVLHISDLDEIPNADIFNLISKNLQHPVTFMGNAYVFCFDLYSHKAANGILIKAGWKNNLSLTWLRNNRTNYQQKIFHKIEDSSYHFSSVGTPEQIANKMKYFAHCNDTPFQGNVRNPEYIKTLIKKKSGFNNKRNELTQVSITDDNLPKYLVENQEKFKHLFYNYYNVS